MEPKQYFTSMAAFCRQQSKMVDENELFWLAEAQLLEKLAINAERQRRLSAQRPQGSTPRSKEKAPGPGANV